jgi:nucleoside-diphosphate-sugar epimerase
VVHDVAKLGWQPKIKLSEGLKPTVQYFRGNDF